MNRMSPRPPPSDNKSSISQKMIVATVVLCTIPFVLNLVRVDFVTYTRPIPISVDWNIPSRDTATPFLQEISASFTHSIMEWCAFCTVFLTAVFTLTHFRISRSAIIPIVGIALLCAGTLDMLHGPLTDHFLRKSQHNLQLAPLIWALCRVGHVLVLAIGVRAILYSQKKDYRSDIRNIVITTILVALAICAMVQILILRDCVPQTLYADKPLWGFIYRPYDLVPLALFAYAGVKILSRFHRRRPSLFSYGIWLSVIPNVVLHVHMAAGSRALFDNHFNIAHFIKILVYLMPLAGLIIDYFMTFKDGQNALEKVQNTQKKLKQVNYDLVLARDRALEANRHKNIFLANMSHELRTPLNSVIGFANIVLKNKDENLSEKELVYVNRICENGKHLLTLINSILDLSKIESGKVRLDITEERLDELVHEVTRQFETQVRDKNLDIVEIVPPNIAPIDTDRVRLKQVMINLIGNAIKFTNSGSITVKITVSEINIPIRIDIIDTGSGIPQEKISVIFEAFQQADTSISRKHSGTGLGLSISQSLCKVLGYRLEVESREGEGSTFSILLTR